MSRAPDVIGTARVIARASSIVWPISNLDRNRAWIGAVTGAVGTIACVPGAVRTITRVTGAVCRITVIISASARAEGDRKQKEQESRPSLFRSSRGGDSLHLRVINNLCSHKRNSKGKAARCEENSDLVCYRPPPGPSSPCCFFFFLPGCSAAPAGAPWPATGGAFTVLAVCG